MLLLRYSLDIVLLSTFGIAVANLGITGYLLALVRDANVVKRQYYILVNPALHVLSPMSILPEWILEESSWFTLATSLITIVDVPIMVFIFRRRLGPRTTSDKSDERYFAWLAIWCVAAINLIMSSSALAWTIRENHGYHEPDSAYEGFDVNAPTSGPYYRYTSSVGFTLASFSCGLAETAVGEDAYVRHLCRIARTPSRLLIAHVALSGAGLLLAMLLWNYPSIGLTGNRSGAEGKVVVDITFAETEVGSDLATRQQASGSCRRAAGLEESRSR